MHAVLVTASVEEGRAEEAGQHLHSNVIPAVGGMPGFVAGYWLGTGLTVLVFDDEEAAQAAARQIPNAPRPDFVTVGEVEVAPVVGHASHGG